MDRYQDVTMILAEEELQQSQQGWVVVVVVVVVAVQRKALTRRGPDQVTLTRTKERMAWGGGTANKEREKQEEGESPRA